jgi:hypothetical protein
LHYLKRPIPPDPTTIGACKALREILENKNYTARKTVLALIHVFQR